MKMETMAGMGMMMDMEMAMPQWFTTKTEMHFFIEDLKIDSIIGIACAMLFSIALALVFEAVSFILHNKSVAFQIRKDKCTRKRITSLMLLTILKMISVLVGYFIMLCVMTYNVWLLVSIVVGSGVAHLVLRPVLVLCLTSSQPETVVSDEEGAKKDLLHDFQADREGYNTFTHSADGKAVKSLKQTESMPLVDDISTDRRV